MFDLKILSNEVNNNKQLQLYKLSAGIDRLQKFKAKQLLENKSAILSANKFDEKI